MANNFKTWIDDANVTSGTNVQAGSTYNNDSQRKNGFQSGQTASSIRVNTALREATLVASAIVNLLGSSADGFDATTTDTNMRSAINTYFNGMVSNIEFDNGNIVVTFKSGSQTRVPVTVAQSTKWFYGTRVYWDGSNPYVIYNVDSMNLNDFYMVTEKYTLNNHTFNKGDIYVAVSNSDNFVILQYVMNITGPQGANGRDGTCIFSGEDLESDSGMVISDDIISGVQVNIGDYYIVASRYTNNSHVFNKGDLFKVHEVGPGRAIYELVYNPVLYCHTIVLGAKTSDDEIYEGTISFIDSSSADALNTSSTAIDIVVFLKLHRLWQAPGMFWKDNVGAIPTVNIYFDDGANLLKAGYISGSSSFNTITFSNSYWNVRRAWTEQIS